VTTSKAVKVAAVMAVIIVVAASVMYAVNILNARSDLPQLIGFDPAEAYRDLEHLAGIGPRVPGTAGDLEGAEYVESRFSEAGLSNVHIEEHEVTVFEVTSATLSVESLGLLNNRVRTYTHIDDFVLYQYSGSTSGEQRFELVDVGDGSEEAFAGMDVSGKAVLSTEQCLPLAADHGVAAVIVQNTRLAPELDFPPYSGGLYGGDSNGDSIPYPDANPGAVVPTCAVSGPVGDEIRSAIDRAFGSNLPGGSAVWARMNFQTVIEKGPIYNVVGDVKGGGDSDEFIYVTAHRDSTYINAGIVDDGTGTVTLMEMARQMADLDLGRTIRFVSVDAEEKGLLGSTEYAKSHEDEITRGGVFVINLDMNDVNLERVGNLDIWCTNKHYMSMINDTASKFWEKYDDLAARYALRVSEGGAGPDGAPFVKRGVEGAFAMGEWGSSLEYHTVYDTIEYINAESWTISGVILGTLAMNIAQE
jgi:hypothetical protein